MHELLKENIDKHVSFSAAELETFGQYFHQKTIQKKEFLLRQGETCKFEGFVLDGCFRIFTFDQKGNDNTLYFAARDWWLMDNDSFMHQNPSHLNMQALEDSEVLLIKRTDKLMLYETLPIVEKLFRVMSQKALVAWQRRLIRNHCETAKERYQNFIDTYPSIALKITDKQLASYLGITHEFLSKIKKR
ncbi:Crp/Fnr family transcriptional regulator [Flammeovirga sp. MY04]|uniref:Crp/Fnr family transcriptional regulator n=1 Tax=Flammeovirga sp. MY04 TaxID=1191459 RepID=UPI000806106E|nr:Crp/Fnr family transcriptional regulator [Flammeovirga sp. MY04]ANQ51268.1 Crp/Fnr family transcriptional regulator [Flammeovirga sp. MY04]